MKKKSNFIGVRVDPVSRMALEQIAVERHVDLSDVARWAFREFLMRQATAQPVKTPVING